MFLSNQVESFKQKRITLGYELTSASKLMSLLSYLKFGMNPMEFELLESYLCPELAEGVEQGWEEVVDASLTYLLRTSLAKNAKDSVLISHQLEPLDDVEKLTKHIGMVFDRLGKGGRLIKLKSDRTKK
jgi:Bardet-Biedl syndrome 9 protein